MSTKKNNIKKKSARKGLVRKLDTLFSLYIRKRDGRCVICGSKENLQCGHLFSRVAYSTRWDDLNCWGNCASCNLSHEYDPYPFTRWFQRRFGIEAYDKLHKKYRTVSKLSNKDLEEKYEEIKKMIEELE